MLNNQIENMDKINEHTIREINSINIEITELMNKYKEAESQSQSQ